MGVKDDLQFAQPNWDEGRLVDTLKITDDEDAKAIAASASRPFGVRRAFLC